MLSRAFKPSLTIILAQWLMCAALILSSSGCVAVAVGAAGGVAGAVYVMGKLKDELDYPVLVVHEAAVAALSDLQLKLSENKSDKLSAHLESEFADGAHVWIDIEQVSDTRSRITIRVGVTGDEIRSRKIYDTTKQHLSRPTDRAS